jgi:hypothetical protein
MSENIQRSKGTPQNYKADRGGVPAQSGPFIGTVMSNVDDTRSGRLHVFIETFADGAMDDDSKWTTVEYLPSFFGSTPLNPGTVTGVGTYPGNRNSYGMWFTPPDIGVKVMCIFVNGERDKGYYIGVIPEQGTSHMVPAIGASTSAVATNENQRKYFENAPQLPVSEINASNPAIINNPRFFEQPKPVHSVQAATMFQQGIITDTARGPVTSSSQRESPSQVFGVSTPGRPIFQGGFSQEEVFERIDKDQILPSDAKVIGRMGGHTLVMDDGSVDGKDQMIRLRTSKGHQITMSDSGDFFYIIHANGQSWLEFGRGGTIDLYSTNSVNIRTQGDLNLHADGSINMFAGKNLKIKSKLAAQIETDTDLIVFAKNNMSVYSGLALALKADGTLGLQGKNSSYNGGSGLIIKATTIDLNGPAAANIPKPAPMPMNLMPDVTFDTATGWKAVDAGLASVVTRAPTHEPYPFHNQAVNITAPGGTGNTTPSSVPMPAGTSATVG